MLANLLSVTLIFIFYPFPKYAKMLYSKVDLLAFAIASVAEALDICSINSTQWRSQEF